MGMQGVYLVTLFVTDTDAWLGIRPAGIFSRRGPLPFPKVR